MRDSVPRPEHPRPQFVRDRWANLNGAWTFGFDFADSGLDDGRELYRSRGFDREITVPFAPESRLSGVGYTDFIPAMWYHRTIRIPDSWEGQRILLHFGAVDYESEAFVDGRPVGLHFGGSSPFDLDITGRVRRGANHDLVVRVRDRLRPAGSQPGGKQSPKYQSHGCYYTRTTGIWQTVWLEAAGLHGLRDAQVGPDLDGGRLICTPRFHATGRGHRFGVQVTADGKTVASAQAEAVSGNPVELRLESVRAWSPEDPFLYDIQYTVADASGKVIDRVESYAGLRKLHVEGGTFFLNNRPRYQRLVLDQGFYPDGIWTAPSDAALKRDIELAMQAGFNGARLHQKVFEERFHYWADRLGYLTWGEYTSWGCDPNNPAATGKMLAELGSIVVRDRNHPSIIAWTPWNETDKVTDRLEHDRAHVEAYELCKALDPTRPVNDASGYVHRRTDLWTVHCYEPDAKALAEKLTPGADGQVWRNHPEIEVDYGGQPYIVDEFGGIKWIPPSEKAYAENSWGYGHAPASTEEVCARLEALVDALLGLKHVGGYCYTQLTDVEQEQNGIFKFDRSEKFDMERIRRIFSRQR